MGPQGLLRYAILLAAIRPVMPQMPAAWQGEAPPGAAVSLPRWAREPISPADMPGHVGVVRVPTDDRDGGGAHVFASESAPEITTQTPPESESEEVSRGGCPAFPLNVEDKVRLDAVPARLTSPFDYLRLAYQLCDLPLPAALTSDYRRLTAFDSHALRLASVLHAKATAKREAGNETLADGTEWARDRFEPLLTADIDRRQARARVLPVFLRPPPDRSIWFDGTALRGALGLGLEALTVRMVDWRKTLDTRSLSSVAATPLFEAPPEQTLPSLIRERLADLLENTDYPFGTPYQSMATVLMRLGPMHDISSEGIQTPAALLERFKVLDLTWKQAPRYPIAPYLAAAFHLSRSSDVLMLDGRPDDLQLSEFVRDRYASVVDAPQTSEAVRAWLAEHEFGLWANIPAIAESPALTLAPAVLREAADEYVRLAALPERMVVTDPVSGARQLAAYLSERLLAYADMVVATGKVANDTETGGEVGEHPRDTARAEIFTARAKERLRFRGKALTRDSIAREQMRLMPEWIASLEASQRLVGRLLVSSTMVRQAEQPGATLLDFVPFVGSAYTFGKGLADSDPGEALRGAFGFSLDAMFGWLGGVGGRFVERQIAREVSEIALAGHEARSLTMLTDFGRQIGAPVPGTLPLERVSVNPDPLGVLQVDASVPLEHRAAAAAARRGETAEVTMENGSSARLVHSPVRGKVTPVRRDGGRLVELDWSGHALRELDFAYGDDFESGNGASAQTGGQGEIAARDDVVAQTAAGLPLPKRFASAIFPDVLSPAFRRRPTVAGVETLFAHLQHSVTSRSTPQVSEFLGIADDAPAPVATQGREILAGLQTLCDRSATMQALLRAALKKMPRGSARVELQIVSSARPVCDIGGGIIRLPPRPQIASASYVDVEGTTPFQPERAWLHELLHAMTKLHDVVPEERMGHRGPVVYLTDRILFEAGHDVQERIMYQPAIQASSIERARSIERQIEEARPVCTGVMITEDAYLDAVLHERLGWPSNVLNQPVARRPTVLQVRALVAEVLAARDTLPLPQHTFYHRLVTWWSIEIDQDLTRCLEWAERFRDYANDFYTRNEIFRDRTERWYAQSGQRAWRLAFVEHLEKREGSPQAWSIDRTRRRLILSRQPIYYQSQSGPRLMELKRRVAGALVDLMLMDESDVLTGAAGQLNRGKHVYLENELVGCRWTYPLRVSAQLAETANSLRTFSIKARRLAEAEDALLEKDRGVHSR